MESIVEGSSEDFAENKLELTRNPFDSQLYDIENFPVLDASIFTETATPQQESDGEFRWSIDHIAKMKPANISPFPNQEYSVVYEKKEDEERDQKQVDEYFKNVLLPSPWLENRSVDALKRVTFSPHPPRTRYISEHGESSYLSNSSYSSPQQGVKCSNRQPLNNLDETLVSDACCQTMLTFPTSFDLQTLIGMHFYTYSDDLGGSKELMVSLLRRKLFGQESNTPVKIEVEYASPKSTPNYVTSSPTSKSSENHRRLGSSVKSKSSDQSFSSPMKSESNSSSPSVFSPGVTESPRQASNVGTPQYLRNNDMTFSSVDVSPIQVSKQLKNNALEESTYSFLPGVSFEWNVTDVDAKESCCNKRFDSPDISPIKNELLDESYASHTNDTNTDSLEPQESALQSIKESTARGIHVFPGFDISSINDNSVKRQYNDILEDVGPLDITDLEEKDTEKENSSSSENEDANALDITDLDTTSLYKETDGLSENIENSNMKVESQEKNDENVSNNNNNNASSENEFISPIFTRILNDACTTTPLKGILKRWEVTPKRVDLGENREENTRYNTVCNSGGKQVHKSSSMECVNKNLSRLPKPVLTEKLLNEINTEMVDGSLELDPKSEKANNAINNTILNEDLVCFRANSALKRATKLALSIEREFPFAKENESVWKFRRNIQLNSTELTGSSLDFSTSGSELTTPSWSDIVPSVDWSNPSSSKPINVDDLEKSVIFNDVQLDSGVSGMEWSSSCNQDKEKLIQEALLPPNNSSISPLLRLNQLSLSVRKRSETSPWKSHDRSFLGRSLDRQARFLISRSQTWPNKENSLRSFTATNAPRSRVLPRSRHASLSYKSKNNYKPYDPIKSAYSDLLPSPLK